MNMAVKNLEVIDQMIIKHPQYELGIRKLVGKVPAKVIV